MATAGPEDLARAAAQFNLEHFLRKLTLEPLVHGKRAPPMPAPKARSHLTPLRMKPGGYRKLEQIKRINSLAAEATFYFNNLNAELGDGAAFKALKLSCQKSTKQLQEVLRFNPYEVENRPAVLFALERGPIMSAQKLAQTVDEDLLDLHFYQPRRNGTLNGQSVEPMFFCQLNESHGMEAVQCVVVPLAPWEFSPQDFADFTCMATFVDGSNSLNGSRSSRPWRNAEKMWAYLYDLCLMNNCQHFILTSYERWAFGGFSAFFTTGYVSETTPWDAKPTSVLEVFTYWILAACHTEGTILIEKVPREKHIDCDLFEKERQLYGKRLLNDGLMGAGPDFVSDEARPAKRARMDPLEERVGWEPLTDHVTTRFASSEKAPQQAWSAAERSLQRPSDQANFAFAKPSLWGNAWQQRRARDEKENLLKATTRRDIPVKDSSLKQPEALRVLEYGPPIPCYSLDVDRENDCFRPDLVAMKSFPKPAP